MDAICACCVGRKESWVCGLRMHADRRMVFEGGLRWLLLLSLLYVVACAGVELEISINQSFIHYSFEAV